MTEQKNQQQREAFQKKIRELFEAGEDLSYSGVLKKHHEQLVFANDEFGGWGEAVNAAGVDYDQCRRYVKWSKEKVIERIKEYYEAGVDLSWSNISLRVDSALAAAALHSNRFSSWNEALEAAGIPLDEVVRYQHWTPQRIHSEIDMLLLAGKPVTRTYLLEHHSRLLAAIYRMGNGLVAEKKEALRRIARLKKEAGKS